MDCQALLPDPTPDAPVFPVQDEGADPMPEPSPPAAPEDPAPARVDPLAPGIERRRRPRLPGAFVA